MNTDVFAELKTSVDTAATAVHRRWRRYVDLEDLTQQLWLWVATNVATNPDAVAEKDLLRRLRNAAEIHCRKEKAQRAGYDVVDEYFYSVPQLERIIWDAFDPEATPPREPYRDDEKYSEWVTEVSEVRAAIRKRVFPLAHYTALREYVTEGRGRDKGVNDALWALRRLLGGGRPR